MRNHILLIAAFLAVMSSSCASICPKEIISPLRGTELGPAVLSPDGQTIVFSVRSKADSRLYKVRTDGTDFLPITIDQAWAHDPVFSQNGTAIIFVEASGGNGDICEIQIDGSGKRCLTSGPDHDYSPVYSPDGSKIYFLRAKTLTSYSPVARPDWHNVDIYSMNVDGTAQTQITSDSSYGMSSLSISPQGEALLTLGSPEDDPVWIISLAEPRNRKNIRPNLDNYRKEILGVDKKVDYQSLRRNEKVSGTISRRVAGWFLRSLPFRPSVINHAFF